MEMKGRRTMISGGGGMESVDREKKKGRRIQRKRN